MNNGSLEHEKVAKVLIDDGFKIEPFNSMDFVKVFLNELESSPCYSFMREIIVISSGGLKEEVFQMMEEYNEEGEIPLKMSKMMIYCGQVARHQEFHQLHPQIVHCVINEQGEIPLKLVEIMNELELEH